MSPSFIENCLIFLFLIIEYWTLHTRIICIGDLIRVYFRKFVLKGLIFLEIDLTNCILKKTANLMK